MIARKPKIAGHVAIERMPCPSVGATMGTTMKMRKMRLIIRAIESPDVRSRTTAVATTPMAAAISPWMKRIASIASQDGAKAEASPARM